MQAYKNLLNELGDQAGQHELIAENLSSSVVQELSTLTKQLKDDRRKVYAQLLYLNEVEGMNSAHDTVWHRLVSYRN